MHRILLFCLAFFLLIPSAVNAYYTYDERPIHREVIEQAEWDKKQARYRYMSEMTDIYKGTKTLKAESFAFKATYPNTWHATEALWDNRFSTDTLLTNLHGNAKNTTERSKTQAWQRSSVDVAREVTEVFNHEYAELFATLVGVHPMLIPYMDIHHSIIAFRPWIYRQDARIVVCRFEEDLAPKNLSQYFALRHAKDFNRTLVSSETMQIHGHDVDVYRFTGKRFGNEKQYDFYIIGNELLIAYVVAPDIYEKYQPIVDTILWSMEFDARVATKASLPAKGALAAVSALHS